jgi:hyperosmotically inducible protein
MNRKLRITPVVILALFVSAGQLLRAQHPISSPASSRGTDRIVREVRHELVMLRYYSVFDNLEYRVNGYTVTLLGQVVRPTLKSDAERAVNGIEGVEQVVNRIAVLPLSPADDRIRRAEYFALFSERSPLFRYGWGAVPPIHIIVSGGHVTLAGVVDSAADKNTAALLANQVSGVFSVTNNLLVGNG